MVPSLSRFGLRGLPRRVWRGLLATEEDRTAAILRWTLATVFFPHGAQKVFGWFGGLGIGGTVEAMGRYHGIPGTLAVLAIATEFLGPIALAAGLLGRLAALGIGFVMLVASTYHMPNGFFMNWFGDQGGEGFEFHILAIGIAAALVWKGSGSWSVDRQLSRGEDTRCELPTAGRPSMRTSST